MLTSDHLLVAATETFLDESVQDAEVAPVGWTLLRRDRDSPCGGTLLAAPAGVTLRRRQEFESKYGEDIWATVTYRSVSFTVCVVYIKPKAADSVYMNVFSNIESFINNLNRSVCLVIGDLNLNSASLNVKNYYCYFLTYCNLIDFNDIVNGHGSILDVVLARECCEMPSRQVCVTEASAGFVPVEARYHPPLEITLNLRPRNHTSDRLLPSNIDASRDWNFKQMDFALFQSLLADTSWAPVIESTDVSVAVNAFYSIIFQLFNQTTPIKRRQSNECRRYPVWFDKDIIKDIRYKTRLHRAWLRSNCVTSYNLFSDLRENLKARILLAYKGHMARIEENLRLQPTHFWNYVHSLRTKGGFEPSVTYKGSLCTGVEAAEAFAQYFSSVFITDLPRLDANISDQLVSWGGNVSIPNLLPEDIERGINKLKLGSSPGPDNVPSFVLKACKKQMILPLYHILNLSLKNGNYPTQWKLSRVIPIPKNSSKTVVEEYRPIAILCSTAKVFEYILHSEIYRQVKHQIGDEQHGFRPGRSVNTNLLCLVDYISGAMDRGLQVDVIYFDFQKAFDKIDNDLLLHKLSVIGFSPSLLNFFADYMRDRRQFVRHGMYVSEPYHTRSGVSQGSVLGPLLFLIMIHDLPTVLKSANCLLYADDLKLFLEINSFYDCLKIQNDINLIYEWSVTNKMFFNLNKCSVMTFDRKKNTINFNYHLDDVCINRVGCVKDLGVTFDRGLTFHDHVTNLAKESFRRLGFVLRNAKDFQNPQVFITLYKSLVRSKLESSACIWNPHQVTYVRMLEKVQKAFLRSLYKKLYGYYPFLYPTKFLLGQLGFNSLEVRRALDQLVIGCKVIRGAVDCLQLVGLLCVLYVPTRYTRGRHHDLYYIPRHNTVARSESPLVRIRRHFNALLDTNTELDLMCDKWTNILTVLLQYCEGLKDQWSNVT